MIEDYSNYDPSEHEGENDSYDRNNYNANNRRNNKNRNQQQQKKPKAWYQTMPKDERAKVAEKHTQLMNLLYKQNIEHSVAETTIYERAFKEGELAIREKADTEFIFIHADTTSAIFEYAGKLQPIESNKTSVKEDKPNENAEEVRTVEESENAEGTGSRP